MNTWTVLNQELIRNGTGASGPHHEPPDIFPAEIAFLPRVSVICRNFVQIDPLN